MRERGTVKWWNNRQGWGFICRQGQCDLFVRHDRIRGEGFKQLRQGDTVEFDVRQGARGPYAANVARLAATEGAAQGEAGRPAS